MEKPIIRLIGGENHGEPMQFPLPADKIAFIDSGSKYSAFLIAHPLHEEARTYLVSSDLLDSDANITDRAIKYIDTHQLWDWGVK